MVTVEETFANQVMWCQRLGSPFTVDLLEWALGDLGTKGPLFDVLGSWPGDPLKDALALRWTGAMHALVLSGMAPRLAKLYPGGPHHAAREPQDLGTALTDTIRNRADWIRSFIQSPPQTNEVARSGVLIGGFLEIARRTRLPLRALEIGASAGLNVNWDRYRYRLGGADWGDATSAVRFEPLWSGPPPATEASLSVARRAACDINPIDLSRAETRLRLRAYVWPDQTARLAALDGAMAFAVAAGTRVEKADAADWVAKALAHLQRGEAAVLYHSIMWQYMPAATKTQVRAAIDDAGQRATDGAPFFWLQFEHFSKGANPELHLSAWPGGTTSVLARAHPHGASVEWLSP